MTTPTLPANEALAPIAPDRRVFGLRDHASLWFSLGVGLLVMQVGAYQSGSMLAGYWPCWQRCCGGG